jgi:hypothetical protein
VFNATSRYAQLGNQVYTDEQGQPIIYKQRRFLPQGSTQPLLTTVTVADGDRLDLIAARTLGASEQFWRICDANDAMNPFTLTDEVGRVLRVSPPQFQEPS